MAKLRKIIFYILGILTEKKNCMYGKAFTEQQDKSVTEPSLTTFFSYHLTTDQS